MSDPRIYAVAAFIVGLATGLGIGHLNLRVREEFDGWRAWLWDAVLDTPESAWRSWCRWWAAPLAAFLRRHVINPKPRAAGRIVGVPVGRSRP